MGTEFTGLSVPQICEAIDMLSPCMDDFVYVYDFVNDFYYISPLALRRFRLPQNQFHKAMENFALFVYPADFPAFRKEFEEIISGRKDFHNLLYRWLSLDGTPLWINCCGAVVSHEGKPLYMIGCVNEVGARPLADNVSGLLGFNALQEYLFDTLRMLPKGLIRLGLDDFKEINERLGNDYGDLVLKNTADCINACLLPQQKLFHAVADEYVIVSFEEYDSDALIEQYKKIRKTIDRFIIENNYEAVYTVSGGILTAEQLVGLSFSEAMKFAEFALSEAKRRGKNCCSIFCREDYDKFLRRRRLLQLLRRAVTHNFEGFEVYLQPLVDIETNTLYGAEALMRFHTEELGMVSPSEFIPLLEDTGLIIPAGKWILNTALSFCRKIQEKLPNFKISINVSYMQVNKSNILSEILTAIAKCGVPPQSIIIELTESGMLSPDERVTKLWASLREQGVHLALDDFGTGYSNFHYLNDLRPDIIKIDRSVTARAVEGDYEFRLLSLMSNLVHSMNLRICVEGIENPDELTRMKELPPDYCQGFLFGKPCPFEEFAERFVS